MTRTLHLIVEAPMDGELVRAILKVHFPALQVRVTRPTGNNPNLARLAQQIEQLIASARRIAANTDCIAVLHDADRQTRPHDRADYERIETACALHAGRVLHVQAVDEIEAWLLADSGVCQWLGEQPANRDQLRQPSDRLGSWMKSRHKLTYRKSDLRPVMRHLRADGHERSPSMRAMLDQLRQQPCTQGNTP